MTQAAQKPELTPKGYECEVCKKWNGYQAYVYAHWDEVLTHTCECGAKTDVLRGRTVLKRLPPDDDE